MVGLRGHADPRAAGFLLANYGLRTALWTLIVHVAYGAIVGGFTAHLA